MNKKTKTYYFVEYDPIMNEYNEDNVEEVELTALEYKLCKATNLYQGRQGYITDNYLDALWFAYK